MFDNVARINFSSYYYLKMFSELILLDCYRRKKQIKKYIIFIIYTKASHDIPVYVYAF